MVARWALTALCVAGGVARAQPGDVPFDIRAQPLNQALVAFAVQADLSIGDAGIDLTGLVARPVKGNFTPSQALTALLAGTGYDYTWLDPQTVQIRRATPQTPLAGRPPAGASLGKSQLVGEVLVTATKRRAVAQSLPNAIVVLSGTALSDTGSTVSNDLTGRQAGLAATNLGAGQDRLFIRGLADSVITGRSQSTVGLYLDDSRVTDDAPDPGLRLVDIDRVEILRGPQGTLYGAGTLGGLVRIVTNQPVQNQVQGMVAGSVAATAGGGASYGTDAMVNLPLIKDALTLRMVGYVKHDGGYINDIRLGRKNINYTNTLGTRLALRWQENADWRFTFGMTLQQIAAADSQYADAGLAPLTRANYLPEPRHDRFSQTSLTIEHPLSWGALTSTTAYTLRQLDDRYDATLGWQGLTGFPQGPASFDEHRNIGSITHETRVASSGQEPWSWLSGVFLSHRDEEYRSSLVGPNGGGSPYPARSEIRDDHADEAALFGEASYLLTGRITLTTGVRLFYASLDAAAQVGQPAGNSFAHGSNHAVGATPKLVLSVRPRDPLLFYGSIAEGFRLGGVNINSPAGATNVNAVRPGDDAPSANAFASDTLWTYELGAKTTWLQGRLIANGAAYLTMWDNVQSDQILPDGSLYIANVGNVRDPGIESDVSFQATPHLRMQANLQWCDPEIIHANPLLIQTSGRLPGVPESGFGVSGRYDTIVFDDYDIFAGMDYSYVGKSYAGFDITKSPPMGNYSIADARAGVTRGPWQLLLYVNNLADARANSFAYGNPFSFGKLGQITPLRPRTIGLSISRNF